MNKERTNGSSGGLSGEVVASGRVALTTVMIALSVGICLIGGTVFGQTDSKTSGLFELSNDLITCKVLVEDGSIIWDSVTSNPALTRTYGAGADGFRTDADFGVDFIYTSWRPLGKANNSENPVMASKADFKVLNHEYDTASDGTQLLTFLCDGIGFSLEAQLAYQLPADGFYVRRSLAVRDTTYGLHYLQQLYPRSGILRAAGQVIKDGGYGQPVAMELQHAGLFFGLEYPASFNTINKADDGYEIGCYQEYGYKIGADWIESDPVVMALTPNKFVKHWFFEYVDDIRVAPLRPYTLYNSWYDLRSTIYPGVPEENWMTEANIMRIIGLIRENMIDKNGIKLDAFVLDDGWDIYESDWVLNPEEFPNGLKPISDELAKTDTRLGIWFGPIGGYSFRDKRLSWMKEHGYETVWKQLCIAGEKYSTLFHKRVTDFVVNEGVAYFKWDGVQYTCSEPDHGHPVGLYSRRAVLESVIDKCRAVRELNPQEMFLNVTSGIWLSPWWLKYANTIWMDGYDYGYAGAPSISPRDAAITYRDVVLYEDFHTKKLWFPLANLMTHGIIKGTLQMLGGNTEPIDKFTDEALFYVARGPAMWELYVSPDILTDAEWNAIARSLDWGRDRFDILVNTEMIGGNPAGGHTYGYVHYKDSRGILVMRNPDIKNTIMTVKLDPAHGLSERADSLVLERVYPNRWISPKLYTAGDEIDFSLDPFMAAVYEVYPINEAASPLLADAVFDMEKTGSDRVRYTVFESGDDVRLLNPEKVQDVTINGSSLDATAVVLETPDRPEPLSGLSVSAVAGKADAMEISVDVHPSVQQATLTVLLRPHSEDEEAEGFPLAVCSVDGEPATVTVEGEEQPWKWYIVELDTGVHQITMSFAPDTTIDSWTGEAAVWMACQQKLPGVELTLQVKGSLVDRVLPPTPVPPGLFQNYAKLGDLAIEVR